MDEYVNIIWYDEYPSNSIEDTLSTIHYHVILCRNIEILLKSISNDVHQSNKILLILSGEMDHESILNTVHDERRIVSIFIFNQSMNISFERYTKICGLFIDYESLEKNLLLRARILNHQAAALSFDEKLNEKSMEELIENPEAVLFDAHSRFSSDRFITSGEKDKLLKYCRRRYASNSTQLKLIDQFEKTYNAIDAIRWYSKDCFLFISLNKCMRKQLGNVYECDMVYFAVDLSVQLQYEWKKQKEKNEANNTLQPFHVYRGLSLPDLEIARIQEYKGKSVTVKGFLSTTKSFAVAQMFAANLIFDITIEPKLDNIIYANISDYSYIPDEEEILIDFGTTFQIVDIVFDVDSHLWIVELLSINEIDRVINAFIAVKRSQGEDDILIARALVFFGYKERGCQLLEQLLNSTDGKIEKIESNTELGEIYAQSGDFMLAAKYFQDAYDICVLFDPNSHRLNYIAFYLAIIYACLDDYERAFNHLIIQIDFPDPEPYSIKRFHCSSWSFLVTNEETLNFDPIQNAYQHLQNNLDMHQGDNDASCKIHFFLGLILLKIHREMIIQKSYEQSLVHFQASQLLSENQYKNIHIWYYYFMGVIYESNKNYNKAKYYYRQMFLIQTDKFNLHELRAITYVRIATCYRAQKKYKLAIKGYIKAFRQSLLTNKRNLIGKVKAHLGITYLQSKRNNEAIEQFIDITTISFVIGEPFICELYVILGETFLKMNDIHRAIEYYCKYLNLYENLYEHESILWCDVCECVISSHISIKQLNDALVYANKLLEYRLKHCSNDYEEIKESQLLLALCYQINKEHQHSIDHYKKAYDTMSRINTNYFGDEYDPLISDDAVTIQSMIATVYREIDNYNQAIYHAEIALETEQKRLSRSKITIISYYDFIGWCYYKINEYDKALEIAMKGLHLLRLYAFDIDPQCCSIYHTLGSICFELNDLKQAYIHCLKGMYILSSNPDCQARECLLDNFHLLLHKIRQNTNDTLETSDVQQCDDDRILSAIINHTHSEVQIIGNIDPAVSIHKIQLQQTESALTVAFQDPSQLSLLNALRNMRAS